MLVVGGRASGKRTFVRSLGFCEGDLSDDPRKDSPVMVDLEEYLRARLWAYGGHPSRDEGLLDLLTSKRVVICTEVGQGIVPLDADARLWRDEVGSVCEELASRADRVVRLVCGIPIFLKGSPPWNS